MSDTSAPKEGDTYACEACGMAILVTEDCESEKAEAFFACCGESMTKADK